MATPCQYTLMVAARVAQGIEQDGPNVKVGGSIPSAGTMLDDSTSCESCQGRGVVEP